VGRIYYHGSDLDGRSSAVILMRKYPNYEVSPMNYHRGIDLTKIKKDEPLIFADVFFDDKREKDLRDLLAITTDITILDHHERKMANRVFEELGIKYKGIIDTESDGACAIVWNYCFPNHPIPMGIKLIGTYDVWKRNFDNIRYMLGLGANNPAVANKFIWNKVLSDDVDFNLLMKSEGSIILKYLRNDQTRYVRAYGIIGKINGYKALAINRGLSDSSIFDSVPQDAFDIYMRFTFTKDRKFKVSITTPREDLDLREIAAKFEGGGHPKASGLIVDKLEDIFEIDDNADYSPIYRFNREAYSKIDKMEINKLEIVDRFGDMILQADKIREGNLS